MSLPQDGRVLALAGSHSTSCPRDLRSTEGTLRSNATPGSQTYGNRILGRRSPLTFVPTRGSASDFSQPRLPIREGAAVQLCLQAIEERLHPLAEHSRSSTRQTAVRDRE